MILGLLKRIILLKMKLQQLKNLDINTDLLTPYKKRILKKIIIKNKDNTKVDFKKTHIAKWGKDKNEKGYIFIEDGFLRSVGLGAEIIAPLSWVFDKKSMYYDPSSESELEEILTNIKLNKLALERSQHVSDCIRKYNVSKYNLGKVTNKLSFIEDSILVIAQVEGDKSVKLGGTLVQKNIDLIKAVKQRFPSKKLLYKPHPDYENKLRFNAEEKTKELKKYCHQILENKSILDCFNITDTVAVNTSLAGFEALIRHKKVICFGEPFYSGWGLTEDISKKYIYRRKRKISLDELVYGALIEYPIYFNTKLCKEISVEEAVTTLYKQKNRNRFISYVIKFILRVRNVFKK